MSVIYDQYGIPRQMEHITAADHLFELKKKSGSSPWPVIAECFKIFEAEHPQKYESHIMYINDVKATRKDPTFASTTDKVTGGILRYTIDIPVKVHKMIRAIYSPEELPMNSREFWIEFAHRFPLYKIAKKL